MVIRDHGQASSFIGRNVLKVGMADRSRSVAMSEFAVKHNLNGIRDDDVPIFLENEIMTQRFHEKYMPDGIRSKIYLLPHVMRLAATRYMLDEGMGVESGFEKKYDGIVGSLKNFWFPTGKPEKLVTLRMSNNAIKKMENLDGATSLEDLYLSHNDLHEIDGLFGLSSLKRLHLDENNIKEIKGIEKNGNLWDLNLSRNKISSIPDLSSYDNIKHLDLSINLIEKDLVVAHLPRKAYSIDLRNNKMSRDECKVKKTEYEKLRGNDAIEC